MQSKVNMHTLWKDGKRLVVPAIRVKLGNAHGARVRKRRDRHTSSSHEIYNGKDEAETTQYQQSLQKQISKQITHISEPLHHHQQQQTTRDDVPRSVLLLTNSTPSQCPAFHRHRPVVTHLLTLQTTSSYARNHSLAASFDYCSLESCPFSASAIGPSLLRQNQALLSIHCTCRCLGHCSPTHCPEDR